MFIQIIQGRCTRPDELHALADRCPHRGAPLCSAGRIATGIELRDGRPALAQRDALVRRVCNEHGGFEPDVRHETNELTMLLALVAAGHAVTLLPRLALMGETPGVAVRPLAGVELTRTLFTAVRAGADRRPALAAVRKAIAAAGVSAAGGGG